MLNVLFMGRKNVAAQSLSWLAKQKEVNIIGVITDSHLAISQTKDVATKLKISVMDREEAEEKITRGEIYVDLALSMLFWQKIRAPMLNGVKLGVINFHPAPLPEYKGTAGYNLAILEERTEWAVSAHYVDENIDTGNIIDLEKFQISSTEETAKTLEEKTQPILLKQFKKVVSLVLENKDKLPSKPNLGGRYVSRVEMEAMKEINEGDDIAKKIRAFWFPPYDGAHLIINGRKYTLVDRFILEKLGDPTTSNLFSLKSEQAI